MRVSEKRRWKRFWIICAALILLALFQSYLLFWGRGSLLSPITQTAQEEDTRSLLQNGDIYISLGDCDQENYECSFVKVPGGSSDYLNLSALVISLLKDNLTQIPVVDATEEWENVPPVEETVLVLDLGFMMDEEGIRDELLLGGGRFPEGRFDQIWIVPAKTLVEDIRFYFYNSQEKKMMTASGGVYTQSSNRLLLEEMIHICENVEAGHLWAGRAFDEAFEEDDFIPIPENREMGNGFLKSVFLGDDETDPNEMRRYGMSFFAYPDTVNERIVPDESLQEKTGLILANEKLTLRIYPDGRVVYLETLTDLEKEEISLSDAYDLAEAFLEQDLERFPCDPMKVVFAGYESEGPVKVFYYDYQLEETELVLDEALTREWGQEWGQPHSIRIEIYGSGVRQYERYVMEASLIRRRSTSYQWIEVMDRMVQMGQMPLSRPELVYVQKGQTLMPMWRTQTKNGYVYFFA